MSDPATNIKFMFDTNISSPAADSAVPLERLEAQICELAGHLAAATCRFLILLGDFDARRGWASWDMRSCAEWLSWKCQMSAGAAREHVRVARALRDLPVIRAEFGAGRLSYAKVRALTRIATVENEGGLAEIAGPMTGNQLERFARAHRQVSQADDAAARVRRRLAWRIEDDGSLAGTFRLPPLAGAVLLKALRASAGDLAHPHEDDDGVSAETREPRTATSSNLADALVAVAEAFLAEKVAGAEDAEVYQVVVHVGTDAIGATGPADVSAETPPAGPAPEDPADPKRCHVQDGPAIYRPDGTALPASPALPEPGGSIEETHDADISPDTIIPAWYGERLDLDHALYICLANARTEQEKQAGRDQAQEPLFEPRNWVSDPSDWIGYFRRYYDEHPAAL